MYKAPKSNVAVARAQDASQQAVWLIRLFALALATALMMYAGAAFAKGAPESFSGLAKKLLPTVVNISTTQTV